MVFDNLKYIAELSKNGYKFNEIKELLTLEGEDSRSNEEESAEPKEVEAPSVSEEPKPEEKPDYEKMYNELADQMNELKANLKAAQAQNVKQNINNSENELTDEEQLVHIFNELII